MRQPQGLQSPPPPWRSRRERAPLWQRITAGIIDYALEIGCRVAGRVLRSWAASHETAPQLTERLRSALQEVLKLPRQNDETAPPRTPEEATESPKRFAKESLEALGSNDWAAERAVDKLVWGLIFRTGPMLLTGGQTPGQALLNVRVVSADGRPISPRQALVQTFGYSALLVLLDRLPLRPAARGSAKLSLLALAIAARFIDPDRRPFLDSLAGTQVVRTI